MSISEGEIRKSRAKAAITLYVWVIVFALAAGYAASRLLNSL